MGNACGRCVRSTPLFSIIAAGLILAGLVICFHSMHQVQNTAATIDMSSILLNPMNQLFMILKADLPISLGLGAAFAICAWWSTGDLRETVCGTRKWLARTGKFFWILAYCCMYVLAAWNVVFLAGTVVAYMITTGFNNLCTNNPNNDLVTGLSLLAFGSTQEHACAAAASFTHWFRMMLIGAAVALVGQWNMFSCASANYARLDMDVMSEKARESTERSRKGQYELPARGAVQYTGSDRV